jgi:hypothetical protein
LNWFTPYASALLDEIHTELATIIQGSRHQSRRKWALLREMLNDCHNNPILNIPSVTPTSYIQFIQGQRYANGTFFKVKVYGSKSAALDHLFRCHPGLEGYPEGFEQELKTLKTGLMRVVQTARADEGEIYEDGKKPMSHDLYKCLARWFFEMGNTDAMFAYCFLVLTWNLMCRANNTTRICILHLLWQWDSAIISFVAQQKADQMGLTEKFPRNLYANPVDYLLCPIFAHTQWRTACRVIRRIVHTNNQQANE